MTRSTSAAVVAILAIVLLTSTVGFAVGTTRSPAATVAVSSSGSGSGPSTTLTPAMVTTAPAAPAAPNPGATIAQNALRAAATYNVKPNVVFVPRHSAPSSLIQAAKDGALVSPLYGSSPAPMGLAYYGLSAGAGNTVVGTVLNTTRLMANVDANATGIRALDLVQSSPDSYGIQLNAVTTGVTLFGHRGYSFWTQNVVLFYPDTHEMILVSNVWNFSNSQGAMSGNALLYNGIGGAFSDGPNGTNNYGPLGFYYGERVLNTPITYPFNLTLYLNSTVVDQRNAVSFGIHLTGPGESFGASAWDYVIFNSVKPAGLPVSQPSNYTANGLSYNPIGLTNDFELTFGGPGGGSQATLFAADAALGLAYYTGAAFVAVPAAYTYGGETGETATGANVAWSSAPGGPAGLSRYGTMTTGPSFLAGLWNATGPVGSYPVSLASSPRNAFEIVTPVGAPSAFRVIAAAVAPTGFGTTLHLAPGNYTVLTELSGYAPLTGAIDVTGPSTVYRNLTATPSLGVYTPLWAFSDSDVVALSTGGSGTPSAPYLMPTSQPAPINATFGLYNDFGFPVYPAVLFYGTQVPVEFAHPPAFTTTTSRQGGGASLPSSNSPPYWFWNVSNVSLVDAATISGWFAPSADAPLFFDAFNVIFYASDHNLVAGNAFHPETGGLLLYNTGAFFGAGPTSGGNTTVWGNTFQPVNSLSAPFPLASCVGIEVAEANDLIYNNQVGTPTTAWQLPLNLYTGAAASFPEAWNISRQPANVTHFASGFPFEPLEGSIAGTSYQGGNAWWDYGNSYNPYILANNPFGYPYTENAQTPVTALLGPGFYSDSYLYGGGDGVPLSTAVLYTVAVSPSVLTAVSEWGVDVWNPSHPYANATFESAPGLVYLPNGSYTYKGVSGPNFTYVGPKNLSLTVAGANLSIVLAFHVPRGDRTIAFTVAGLPKGTLWSVSINGTSPTTDEYNLTGNSTAKRIVFAVAPGNYTYSVRHLVGYTVNAPNGSASTVLSSTAVHLKFRAFLSTVTFSESGLPNGTGWAVTIAGKTHGSTHTTIAFTLPNGTYSYAVHPKAGYSAPYTGSFTVSGAPLTIPVPFVRVTYNVTFSESGLPSGTSWSVKLGATTLSALAPASIVFAMPNGSYSYSVLAVTGYAAAPSSGTVHVAAGPVVVSVTFSPSPPTAAAPAMVVVRTLDGRSP